MNPRIKEVKPLPDFLLNLTFSNGVSKTFDMKPYLTKGIFTELKQPEIFNTAKVSFGTVVWSNGLDLCPDTLFLESK